MYLTMQIECGERLVSSLEKARHIAVLLGVDVMTEVHGELLRVPATSDFDPKSAIEEHFQYVNRLARLRPEQARKLVTWRTLGHDEIIAEGDCYLWLIGEGMTQLVDKNIGKSCGEALSEWRNAGCPHAIIRRVNKSLDTQNAPGSTIIMLRQ
jgi:hypothetical protein